jgi:hypothetical protein
MKKKSSTNLRKNLNLFNLRNKKAQEMSASWTMEWFIQNIVVIILFFLILGAALYFLLRFLTSY